MAAPKDTADSHVEGPRYMEYMALSDLSARVHADNPKDHDLVALRESMARLGYLEPVMLDERTGKLISGHGRVETLEGDKGAGTVMPEGIVEADGDWWVPTTRGWASKDDDDALTALVTLNRTVEAGGWRGDPLVSLLDRLAGTPTGLYGTGFSTDQLADLRITLGPPPSLDEAQARYGQTQPEDFWPTVAFKVPPDVRDRLVRVLAAADVGDDPAKQLGWLLDAAEAWATEAAGVEQ